VHAICIIANQFNLEFEWRDPEKIKAEEEFLRKRGINRYILRLLYLE
jgi:hypothetical protein